MNTFGSTKSKGIKNILGGIPGLFEDDNFEEETSGVTITESDKTTKFSSGSFNNFNENKAQLEQFQQQQTEREQAAQKRIFFQALKEDQDRVQKSKEKLLFEEEI